jgi:chromosome segregation ATPase
LKHGWAVYQRFDTEYQEALAKKELFVEKAKNAELKLSQAEEALNKPDDFRLEKEAQMQELVQEAGEQSNLCIQLEDELKQKDHPRKALQRNIKQLSNELATSKQGLNAAKQRLKQARDEIFAKVGSAQSEEARRALELKTAEEELDKARSMTEEMKQSVSAAFQVYEELEPHVLDARSSTKTITRQLENAKKTIEGLNSSGEGPLAMFSPKVKQVYAMVRARPCSHLFPCRFVL